MAKKKSGCGPIVVGLIAIAFLASLLPKGVGAIVVTLSIVGSGVYWIIKRKKLQKELPTSPAPTKAPEKTLSNKAPTKMNIEPSDFVFTVSFGSDTETYEIPPPPDGYSKERWYAPGEVVEIGGRRISSGMIYVGVPSGDKYGRGDACVIDPSRKVDGPTDYTVSRFDYWPKYSELSPSARAAYLDWLASGRRDPEADIGYIFPFFYGLEKRVLTDSTDNKVASHWPEIRRELLELLEAYGSRSGSLTRYANDLLAWMQLCELQPKSYESPIPDLNKNSYELPILLRAAIGQLAVDAVPLPTDIALQWIYHAPNISLRTPAIRCESEFKRIFRSRYLKQFGNGMKLPCNRTKLRYFYRPASPTLSTVHNEHLEQQHLPDVSVLTKPTEQLRALAEKVCDDLAAYSRLVGRDSSASASVEAQLQLPHEAWSSSANEFLRSLKSHLNAHPKVMRHSELLIQLNTDSPLTKDRFASLARVLETEGIGLEPDVLRGAKHPKVDGSMVFFDYSISRRQPENSVEYLTAMLTLQLSASIAAADGIIDDAEREHLIREIRSWSELSRAEQERLVAHLYLLIEAPVSLASLKSKIDLLSVTSREAVAEYMAVVAQSDGVVHPTEVKLLERAYKILGVDTQKVFTYLHAAATDGATSESVRQRKQAAGFSLDAKRIAELQADSARVSSLLSAIFVDESPSEPQAIPPLQEDESTEDAKRLLDLDEAHDALLRLMLTRKEWTRSDLQDAAADLEVMLDGALERINDTAFDRFDMPFVEGDDPIVVNKEIEERLRND